DHIITSRSPAPPGSLKRVLWATTTVPVFGNTISAYTLGTYSLSPLPAGYEYNNVDTGFLAFTPPPQGCYYVTIALEEYSGGTWYYEDLAISTFGGTPDGSGHD